MEKFKFVFFLALSLDGNSRKLSHSKTKFFFENSAKSEHASHTKIFCDICEFFSILTYQKKKKMAQKTNFIFII